MPREIDEQEVTDFLGDQGILAIECYPDGRTHYSSNHYPGVDIILDWSRGPIPEDELHEVLATEGIELPST